METYITICKTDSQREFAVWLRKLKQGLCINLEGWNGKGDGREVQKGGDTCRIFCYEKMSSEKKGYKIIKGRDASNMLVKLFKFSLAI